MFNHFEFGVVGRNIHLLRMKKIPVMIIVSVLIFSVAATQTPTLQINEYMIMTRNTMNIAGYTSHGPFNITCDQDFVDQGWPGSGTSGDPYVISGLNITNENQAIWIYNTSAHVVIENCYFNITNTTMSFGTYFANASNIVLRDTMIAGSVFPLIVANFTNLVIQNCSFRNGVAPIYFAFVTNASVERNQFYSGAFQPTSVTFFHSNTVTFQHNLIKDFNIYGVEWVHDNFNCFMYNNTLTGTTSNPYFLPESAIKVDHSSTVDIQENKISNSHCGITLSGYNSLAVLNRITDCTQGIVVSNSNGAIIYLNHLNCTFGIVSENSVGCTIASNTIETRNYGILLSQSQKMTVSTNHINSKTDGIILSGFGAPSENVPPLELCVIKDNVLQGGGIQFMVADVAGLNHKIVGNYINGGLFGYFFSNKSLTVDGAPYGSMVLANVEDVTVNGGEFSNASIGVMVLYSSAVTITNAVVHNNTYGIEMFESEECSITNSQVYYNGFTNPYGYPYIEPGAAILLQKSENGTIKSNDIHDNYDGIILEASKNFLITFNLVYNNAHVGVALGGTCSNNRIYQNQIGWNTINAVAKAANNYWDDGVSLGNYWSDYNGTGEYPVDPNGIDHYPLPLTKIMPIVTGGFPVDIGYVLIGGVVIAAVVMIIVYVRKR